jgi:phosphonoacetaldehyde hydrolase
MKTTPRPSDFSLVIFDWAGTMVDFGCLAPVQALKAAFARQGVTLEDEAARADMGKAKDAHVRALLDRSDVASAWVAARGVAPIETDVARIMADLGPLMRDAAEASAQLIPGALETVTRLQQAGMRIASSTGYTREMMQPVLARAAAQGYSPELVVCAGETPEGRPSPLMIYKACAELGVWPLSRVIKVDDAEAGVAEGKAAGCFTIGLTASGNGLGLSLADYQALSDPEREQRLAPVRAALLAAGADRVIDTVADLPGLFGLPGGLSRG